MMIDSMNSFVKIQAVLEGLLTNKEIQLRGWIYRTRSSGKIVFLTIRDATGILQATIKKGNLEDYEFKDAKKALIESSLIIKGTVVEDPRAPGGYELSVNKCTILNFAEVFPITEDQSTEFLMDKRHLWIRSQKLSAVFKIRSYSSMLFKSI